jgi:hypothetical protein
VASLAILADDRPNWKPDHFSYELLGCKAGIWYPTVKLLDYKNKWDELENDVNPFSTVVMAHFTGGRGQLSGGRIEFEALDIWKRRA